MARYRDNGKWVKFICPNCHKRFREKIWVHKEPYEWWEHTHCPRCEEEIGFEQQAPSAKEEE